jgi:hypothetical protein
MKMFTMFSFIVLMSACTKAPTSACPENTGGMCVSSGEEYVFPYNTDALPNLSKDATYAGYSLPQCNSDEMCCEVASY